MGMACTEVFCRESVPDHLAGHVGSEDELEAAGPVRLLGQHPLRLARFVTRLAGWNMPEGDLPPGAPIIRSRPSPEVAAGRLRRTSWPC